MAFNIREAQMDKLQKELAAKARQLDNSEGALIKAKQEAAEAKQAATDLTKKLQQLTVERTDLTGQVGRLEKEARQRAEQVAHLERQLEDGLGKTIRTPGASTPGSTGPLGRTMSRIGDREAEVKALSQQLIVAQQEIAGLRAERTDAAKLATDMDTFKQRSEDLRAQLAAAQKQVLALERAEVAQRDQAKALEIANQRMEASLTIAREQMVTLKGVNNAQKEQLEAFEATTTPLRSHIELQAAQIQELQVKLNDIVEEKARLQEAFSALQAVSNDQEGKLKDNALEIGQLSANVAAKTQAVDKLETEARQSNLVRANLESQLAATQQKLAREEAAWQERALQLAELQAELGREREAGAELTRQLKAAKERVNQLDKIVEQKNADLAEAGREGANRDRQLRETSIALAQKTEEASKLAKRVENYNTVQANLDPVLEATQAEVDRVKAELRLKNDEVLALSVELASAKRQLEVATQIRSKTAGSQEQASEEQLTQEELIGVFRH